MSVSTSMTNTNLYPNSSSDSQWNQDTSNVNPPSETQYLVAEQQYRINSVTCNGSSTIYNTPKVNNVNNLNCINGQMQFNPPNYAGTCASNTLPGQDIRFHNTYNGLNNHGIIHGTHNVHLGPSSSNTWTPSVGPRDRLVSRQTWNSTKPISGGVKKAKRIRTAFTSQQMMELENEYIRTRYLDRSRRIELSEILKLNERTIKIWFQNRRMKEKKDRTENHEDTEATSTTEISPEHDGRQMIVYDPYPHNGVFNRNIYVEQYPVVSTGMMVQQTVAPPLVGHVENAMNSYPTFVVDNNLQLSDLDMQYRQMSGQMRDYSIVDKIECKDETLEDSSHQSENSTNDAPIAEHAQNWDLSWIRSIDIDEEL
uniref:Hox cluster protein ShxA n=1 Tax=Polygonia c-album TaxID=929971 RepID=A0A060D2W8_POLCL|nr:Hox cluster protein ShxA [Nymphalis c-album]